MAKNFEFDHPQRLSGMQLRNGYCLAPLSTRTARFSGEVSRDDCYFHEIHAKQVGMDIVGSAYVHPSGSTVTGSISVADDQKISGLHHLAKTIQGQGARAILQIVHAGRMTNRIATNGAPVVAPSTVTATHGKVDVPMTLSVDDIYKIVDQFGAATQRAILAGFDGVEIHGANSFLLQQFMSPLTNKRTDQFGGSLANRVRFPLMVAKRVLNVSQQAQQPFVVGYRLSPEEIEPHGLSIIDNLVLAQLLTALPLSYLSLSMRDYNQMPVTQITDKSVRALFKGVVGNLPLMVAGGIKGATDVCQLEGSANLLAIGQQLILNPSWPSDLHRSKGQPENEISDAWQAGLPQSIFRYL